MMSHRNMVVVSHRNMVVVVYHDILGQCHFLFLIPLPLSLQSPPDTDDSVTLNLGSLS